MLKIGPVAALVLSGVALFLLALAPLGWRAVTGVKTVQSECGILATAKPAPLRKNPGKYILA